LTLKKVILVRSLKKRGDDVVRQIPISQRLLETLADYLKGLKPKDEEAYLFPGIWGSPTSAAKQ
jgi:integrase/recombinase XerD